MNAWESFLPEAFTRAFSLTLLHSLWQGALIALLALVALMLLRRHRATIRYGVLYTLMALIPVMFCITFFTVYQPGASVSADAAMIPALNQWTADAADPALALNASTGVSSWPLVLSSLFRHQTHWFFLMWFAGFMFFLLKFTGSLVFVYRLKSYRIKEVPQNWERKMAGLSGKIGIRRLVRLSESALVRVPVTIGYLKPVILLPVGTISGVPPQQIEAILLHELAHILRRDYVQNIIQSIIELLFFYHPVTWWLSAQIRQEREHICDDIALSIYHDRINYIKALTTMEEMNCKSPALAPALTGTKKKLLSRVKRVLNPQSFKHGMTEGIAAVILLSGLIFTFSANALNFAPGLMSTTGDHNKTPGSYLTAFDLSGGETGEKTTNLLPESFLHQANASLQRPGPGFTVTEGQPPDSIVKQSGAGRVTVKVYTDSIQSADEETLEVIVERMDRRLKEWEKGRRDVEKEMIIVRRDATGHDSLRQVMIVRDGDTTILRAPDIEMKSPPRAYRYYQFHDLPDLPEIPDYGDFDVDFDFDFDFDAEVGEQFSREMEKQARELEFKWQQMDRQHELMDKKWKEKQFYAPPRPPDHRSQWYVKSPEPPAKKGDRLIRQELRSDGLTLPGKQYVVELDARSMYINGEKQSKDVYKKYKRLVESLGQVKLEGGESFKLMF